MRFWNNVHLPLPEGPYIPGCIDVMTGYSKEGTFIRLHYPSNRLKQDPTKWINWAPDPEYVQGFSAVTRVWVFVIRFLLWLYSGTLKIPVLWEAPVADNTKMPVILFSHGFGASRFICSTLCYELASHGFLVASVEHRDTSACASYYYQSEEDCAKDKKTWVLHQFMDLSNMGPEHYKIRNAQIKLRRQECVNALNLLEEINKGTALNILPCKLPLSVFKDNLDFTNLCMMGHSFGGATSLLTLDSDPRLKMGVILDGWMFSIKNELLCIPQPLLFLNTQTFHIKSNLTALGKIIQESPRLPRTVFTVLKTNHESQTDSPTALGFWMDWFLRKLDHEKALRLQSHMVLRFLNQTTGFPKDASASDKYIAQFSSIILDGLQDFSITPRRPFTFGLSTSPSQQELKQR
uniref:1-alkyl-2-acetylglycerophosphocholine esterase n=2 Tax=Cacopsylla melanoneura TaxID=428564 RepID=A0A8D9BJU0_9HEMI